MSNRREFLISVLATAFGTSGAPAETASGTMASDEAIRAVLRERIDIGRQSVGIVVGLIDPTGLRMVTHGRSGTPDGRPLDGDTVFEIGSITKVFTALLLADMVQRGEVELDDPVGKFLPAEIRVPAYRGKEITLLDLATHTASLPASPRNAVPNADDNPLADYSVEKLYAFLSQHTLRCEPGTWYEYTNAGFGLLGHVLALRANRGYEELVVERICAPLGLNSTRISLSASMRERLAQGHDAILQPIANWDMPAMAGTGALRSTANDLCAFIEAASLARSDTPLRPSMELLLKARRQAFMNAPMNASTFDVEVGVGWSVLKIENDELVWKDGATGGYTSFIGFSAPRRRGAIVLSNAGYWHDVGDIGLHLLNAPNLLRQYPPQVVIDPAIMAKYAGNYAVVPNFALIIRAEAGRLFVHGTGQREFELFAEDDNRFFMRSMDAQGTFLRNAEGDVRELLWHQNGRFRYCPRVS